jgi:tRNA1(Val) A37 N6-methylase TrmN6
MSGDSAQSFTVDAFHRGRFFVVQPKGDGHRSGVDAMMLAATVPDGFSGRCADLGAGAGAAGLAVASRLPGASVVLIENDPVMADCARRTLALAENAAIAARMTVLEADLTLRGAARPKAGLEDGSFDFAILNPPFNDPADRRTPDIRKQAAHVMDDTLFEDWLRTVSAILKPGGTFALIARPHSLGAILNAIGRRFGGVSVTPVHARGGQPAIRILATGIKGSRARMVLKPAHVLHENGSDAFLPFADAVNNGLAALG